MKKLMLLPLFGLLLFQSTSACSCIPNGLISPEDLNDANAVFTGIVSEIKEGDDYDTVTLKVEKKYKGDFQSTAQIVTASSGAMCGLNFARDQKWLIFAYKNRFDQLAAGLCSRSTKKLENNKDIPFLDSLVTKSGMTEFRYEDDTISGKGAIQNGCPKGEWTYYYENGNMKAKGDYKDCLRSGMWEIYDFQGRLERVTLFSKGERIKTKNVELIKPEDLN